VTRVLVTNDDGIDAPGVLRLAVAAREAGFAVTLAAPAFQSSGSSASIMATEQDGHIRVEHRKFDELSGVPAFAVHGGPGLIALVAAYGAFGAPPDIVLSGVNHGANVGRAILHSGTVGAALTGGLNGAWGIAVSLDVGMAPQEFFWDAAARVTLELLPELQQHPKGTVINVNVPNQPVPRGVCETTLAPFGIVHTTLSERDEHRIRLAVEELPVTPVPGSDAARLSEGWATVTGIVPVSGHQLGFVARGG